VGGQEGVGATLELRLKKLAIGSGFLGEDIDSCSAEMTGAEGLGEGWDLDNSAAGGVDEEGALLHLVELIFANHILSVLCLGDVEGDKVSLGKELRESVDLLGGTQGHQWSHIVEEDTHAHRLCKDRELRTNVSIANNSYLFIIEVREKSMEVRE
jgi:hypothetical protein